MADKIVRMYESSFNPQEYFEVYYKNEDKRCRLNEWFIEFLHRLFAQGKIHGKNLLDVGCGSTIQSVISASSYIENIYMADILEKCRNEAEKWLRNDPDALDHARQLNHIAKLEGINDIKIIEDRIRKSVKGVLPCNILNPNPLAPMTKKFDVVISSLCVDCYPNLNDYYQAYKNICSLVRQGGYVVFQETMNASTYKVGNFDFPVPWKDITTTRQALSEANIRVLATDEHYFNENVNLPTDANGFIGVFGIKL